MNITDKIEKRNDILDTNDCVYGIIYKITNNITNQIYIGQTRSHRKNHNKYRPFGEVKRFLDHVSEAYSQSECKKKKNCRYLNNAIRKYGKENFDVNLLLNCDINELDIFEKKYIESYNSLYPNGYNLTIGGKTFYVKKIESENTLSNDIKEKYSHSIETKNKIGSRIKEFLNSGDNLVKKANIIAKNNDDNKIKILIENNIDITIDDFEKFVHIRKDKKNNKEYVLLIINNIKLRFYSKYDNIDALKDRIKQLIIKYNEVK